MRFFDTDTRRFGIYFPFGIGLGDLPPRLPFNRLSLRVPRDGLPPMKTLLESLWKPHRRRHTQHQPKSDKGGHDLDGHGLRWYSCGVLAVPDLQRHRIRVLRAALDEERGERDDTV